MKKLMVCAALLCSPLALAEVGDSYFGAAYTLGKFEENGFPTTNPKSFGFEYGKYIFDSIAIEGNFAFGLGEDSLMIEGFDVDFKLKQSMSLFLKGDLALTDRVNFYGLLGFTQAEFKASAQDIDASFSEKDSGFSYGIGLESKNTEGYKFSLEYVMYLTDDGYDYSGVNFGLAKMF